MSQTRRGSLIESLTNIVAGIGISFASNLVLLPLVLHTAAVPLLANLALTAFFTGISLVRSYLLRRLFNRYHTKDSQDEKRITGLLRGAHYVRLFDCAGRELRPFSLIHIGRPDGLGHPGQR